MNWIFTSLNWYVYVLFIGIIFFPLTKKVFSRFSFDFGYPFAKALAIITVSYVSYVLGLLKIVPFTRFDLFLILGVFLLINLFIKTKGKKTVFTKQTSFIIFSEEVLFLTSFIFWAFIRSQEPSLRSLEKFMDFGFINSILRSKFFPPLDIWYTPMPINYYYFGHLTGALLIKLSNIKPSIGYNLILATIFAQGITSTFSLVANIIKTYSNKVKSLFVIFFALIGAFLVNLGGNLHTIYLFTTGYPNDSPVPFWKILSFYNPTRYWYPNATRFIPFTIHEFPSYSWVVADLHGHVFDIPFVLLTIAIMFLVFTKINKKLPTHTIWSEFIPTIFLGFMASIHYMTNAFDGPIYLLLTLILFFFLYRFTAKFFKHALILVVAFIIFVLPFSSSFTPFVNGIGVNCSPEFLTNIGKIGPFLFEKDKCQTSPLWMMFVLWGFFWINFILFAFINRLNKKESKQQSLITDFIYILFFFGTFLVIIPEFFYIKDIYPQHFRANTMFKLGYQAFMMMGLASIITFFKLKLEKNIKTMIMSFIFLFFAFFVAIYPFFSVPSYYGNLDKTPNLDGSLWLKTGYAEDLEIIDYLNSHVKGQPVILEAQGDSYTDYERISANTGLPTVAGWWVHEWLWRGSSDIVGKRIPEVQKLYQSKSIDETTTLIKKYKIEYIVVSQLERQKYPDLNDKKFFKIANLVLKTKNGSGALYQVK